MSEQRKWFAPYGEQTGMGPAHAGTPLKKKLQGLLALGLCLCLGLGLLPAPALAAAPTTSWTDAGNFDTSWYVGHESDTEFTLTTAKELAGLASLVNGGNTFSGKTVKLGANIDLSAHLWTPIGSTGYRSFGGTFDGGGKTLRGMVCISSNADSVQYISGGGFIYSVDTGASIYDLRIQGASLSYKEPENSAIIGMWQGILAIENKGEIYNCAVSGSVSVEGGGSATQVYVGGLVGNNTGTVKNSSSHLTSVTVVGNSVEAVSLGGIAGGGTGAVENCFVDLANNLTTQDGRQYRIAPVASYSYWDSTTTLTDSAAPNAPAYTQCYAVTAEQMAGTGSAIIGQATDTYANTSSLLTALNGWVAANAGHGEWSLSRAGSPLLGIFVPDYIDIGDVPEQSKDSATGTLDADVQLKGQIQENVELISVTLPASIPFILDVDSTGALNRVLSGTGTLTNRSDMGVTVTLTSVTDPDSLLTKADLSLVPAPLPAGGNVALSVGTGKTDVLSTLAAQTGGVPATSTLKVDGAAKASVPSVGGDGDTFTVGLTLKVSKT